MKVYEIAIPSLHDEDTDTKCVIWIASEHPVVKQDTADELVEIKEIDISPDAPGVDFMIKGE